MDHHQVSDVATQARDVRSGPIQQFDDFAPRRVKAFLDQKPPVEHRATQISDARGLYAADRLTTLDSVDIERSVLCSVRYHRHLGRSLGNPGHELATDALEYQAHMLDGVHAMERHAAMRDSTVGGDLEPVHAPMADADAIDVQRLWNDDEIGALRADVSMLRQP